MKFKLGKYCFEIVFKITIEESFINEVKALLRNGNKLKAIKLYKEKTFLGLKESKEAVDNILNSDLELNKQYHESSL